MTVVDAVCYSDGMRAHPEDLVRLLEQMPGQTDTKLSVCHAAHVDAFLQVCRALEPDMVWSDGEHRTKWLIHTCSLRSALKAWTSDDRTILTGTHRDIDELVVLSKLASTLWRGPSDGPLEEFSFMKDSRLRSIAERDRRSLTVARQTEQTKMALVLAGSVIEALLLDVLEHDKTATREAAVAVKGLRKESDPAIGRMKPGSTPEKWPFLVLIAVSGQAGLGVLSKRAESVADTLRDWRNYVHPAQERNVTDEIPLGPNDAALAEGLAVQDVEEVRRWWAKAEEVAAP